MIQNPSAYQLAVFDALLNTNQNIVISASAGAAKTSTIITGAKLLPSSTSSCFLAFNKAIVENLQSKLPPTTLCRTAHSIGMQALIQYYRINFRVNEFKNLRFIDEKLKTRTELNPKQKIALQFIILEIINFIRMNMSPYDIESISQICDHHSIVLEDQYMNDVIEILYKIDFYNKSFSKTYNQIDFTDMIYLAVGNPKIRLPQFDVVFVDEMQDLTRAQQLLVEKLTKPKGRIVAVGDKNQCIYQWAGASGDSFEYFQNRPNTITLPLSISYRCSLAIVRNAREVYPEIEPYDQNEEGEVRDGSIDEITSDDLIICRNTKPLIHLYFLLLERGQGAKVIGRDIEGNLLKVLSKVVNYDVEVGLEKLKEERLEMKKKLIAEKKNLNYNKKYIHLSEQIQVIQIISKGCSHMSQVESKIKEIFNKDKTNVVRLMSCHRSKGLENDRVFMITHFEGKKLIPSPYAQRSWELVGENNILFVALTRAKKSLIFIKL